MRQNYYYFTYLSCPIKRSSDYCFFVNDGKFIVHHKSIPVQPDWNSWWRHNLKYGFNYQTTTKLDYYL